QGHAHQELPLWRAHERAGGQGSRHGRFGEHAHLRARDLRGRQHLRLRLSLHPGRHLPRLHLLRGELHCLRQCGLPARHPYAGTDTQFVVLLAIDNRRGLEHRLRVNANLDLWFYESVLRPETASINPQKNPTWFLPFRRGKGKMPPSQASVSGHGVYCPSRSAAQQYENTIRNFKTFCSYRSLVVMGQPSFLMMDCLGTETYIKPMPGEPSAHIILAYEDNGIFPLGRDGVLRRIENLEFQNPASKSVEIDRIRYDQSGFISRAGDASWLG